MDTLAFSLHPRSNAPVCPTVDVRIVLNGQPLAEGLVDVVSLLAGRTLPLARFYLYTCGCGVPGCAGFHDPLVQRRSADTVVWTTEDPALARVLGIEPNMTRVFDAQAFDTALSTLYKDLLVLQEDGYTAASEIPESYRDEDSSPFDIPSLHEGVERAYGFMVRESRLALLVEEAVDPTLPRSVPFLWNGEPLLANHICPVDIETAVSVLLDLRGGLDCVASPQAAAIRPTVELVQRFAQNGDVALANERFAPFVRFGYDAACEDARRCHESEPVFGPVFREVGGVGVVLVPW